MLIRQRKWQAVTVGKILGVAVCLSLGGLSAQAQTGGGGGGSTSQSSGGSLLGGGGSGTSSSSMNTGSGTTSGSSTGLTSSSGNSLAGSSNTLSNSSSTLSNTGLSGAASTFTPAPAGTIGPSATNIIAPYYANPLLAGLPNYATGSATGNGAAAKNTRFGQSLYVPANTSLSAASASRGSSGLGGSGMQSTAAVGMSVGPRFTQTLGWRATPTTAGNPRLQTELQGILARTPSLVSAKNIQVVMEGQTAVLKGTAADDHERALAGSVISMSPGVYGVRNDLKVQGASGVAVQPSAGGAPAASTGSPTPSVVSPTYINPFPPSQSRNVASPSGNRQQ